VTWTYTDPSSSDRDAIRFLIGDTDVNDQQLSNEELDFCLSEGGSVKGAAREACEALIAKYTRLVNQSTGSINISYGDRLAHYQQLLVTLRGKMRAVPWAGGSSIADKTAREEDEDRPKSVFTVGGMDYE